MKSRGSYARITPEQAHTHAWHRSWRYGHVILVSPLLTQNMDIQYQRCTLVRCEPRLHTSVDLAGVWPPRNEVLSAEAEGWLFRISQKPNLIIVLLYIVLKKITANALSQRSHNREAILTSLSVNLTLPSANLTLLLEIMHCARNL